MKWALTRKMYNAKNGYELKMELDKAKPAHVPGNNQPVVYAGAGSIPAEFFAPCCPA